ncbi:MAG: pimeloyl-ACP methyl ester esterase BioH [Zetaproteobacteria bacterium]|nr:MAG: pimeloyl-ACP methyl ester esterase BioH [Zetaproteobacteria bacterium]
MRPALVFVPGWGQSGKAWHKQSVYFSKDWPVQVVNLPGHGGMPDAPAGSWLKELSNALPDQPCILVGWSLGGMLAIQLAHCWPEKLVGLVLVSSTPCFRVKSDWEQGCSDEQFHAFEQALEHDPDKLLGQFFMLMLHGDAMSRGRFNAIAKEAVDRKHPPLPEALRSGLKLLDTLDLRAQLADILVPTLVMHGTHDQIAPVEAGRYLAGHIPDASLRIMEYGHAPHLTQDKTFNEYLEQWCLNII